MSDWTEADLTDGPGYYRAYYGAGLGADGPFDTVRELAEATEMYEFPSDGYIISFDGAVVGTVASLNPDDLLDRYDSWTLPGDETDDVWECPDGCPFVIQGQYEAEYHVGWHRAEDEREAARGRRP